MTCEFEFNYLSKKIALKFQLKNFRFTLKLPEIVRTSTFIIKKIKNSLLNNESLGELENSETEFSLKEFLKRTDL